ncbi:MAG: hypothetical protein JO033_12705 [Acidobacteriaceae bacterium]|nr:hypothetical protein [Acidobacteriaceae bacterium]MBV9498824.1 hypothetical protein [Acidobacteriaceae bacterium]
MGTIRNIAPQGWLTQFRKEIQVLDYELHASLRILAAGEMDSDHMAALVAASARRDQMMVRVMAFCKSRFASRVLPCGNTSDEPAEFPDDERAAIAP